MAFAAEAEAVERDLVVMVDGSSNMGGYCYGYNLASDPYDAPRRYVCIPDDDWRAQLTGIKRLVREFLPLQGKVALTVVQTTAGLETYDQGSGIFAYSGPEVVVPRTVLYDEADVSDVVALLSSAQQVRGNRCLLHPSNDCASPLASVAWGIHLSTEHLLEQTNPETHPDAELLADSAEYCLLGDLAWQLGLAPREGIAGPPPIAYSRAAAWAAAKHKVGISRFAMVGKFTGVIGSPWLSYEGNAIEQQQLSEDWFGWMLRGGGDITQTLDRDEFIQAIPNGCFAEDVELLAIEITQGPQSLKHQMPLLAKKQTVVRAHLRTQERKQARADIVLHGWNDSGYLGKISGLFNPALVEERHPLTADVRANPFQSQTWGLPLEWTQSGSLEVEVEQVGADLICSEQTVGSEDTQDCKLRREVKQGLPAVDTVVYDIVDSTRPAESAVAPIVHARAINRVLQQHPINGIRLKDFRSLPASTSLADGPNDETTYVARWGYVGDLHRQVEAFREYACIRKGACNTVHDGLFTLPASAGGPVGSLGAPFVVVEEAAAFDPHISEEHGGHEWGHGWGLEHVAGDLCDPTARHRGMGLRRRARAQPLHRPAPGTPPRLALRADELLLAQLGGPSFSCATADDVVTCSWLGPDLAPGEESDVVMVEIDPDLAVVSGGSFVSRVTATADHAADVFPLNDVTSRAALVRTANFADLGIRTERANVWAEGFSTDVELYVDNLGEADVGDAITVTYDVPPGAVVRGVGGEGWDCDILPGGVSCSWIGAPLVAGETLPPIVVEADVGTAGGALTSATVSTALDSVADNDQLEETAEVVRLTTAAGALAVYGSFPDGSFIGSRSALLVEVQNLSVAEVTQAHEVQAVLPAGVSFAFATGHGWSCAEATSVVTCGHPATDVATGGYLPRLLLYVDVEPALTGSVTFGVDRLLPVDDRAANDSGTLEGFFGGIPFSADLMIRATPSVTSVPPQGSFDLDIEVTHVAVQPSQPTVRFDVSSMANQHSFYELLSEGDGWSCERDQRAGFRCERNTPIASGETTSPVQLRVWPGPYEPSPRYRQRILAGQISYIDPDMATLEMPVQGGVGRRGRSPPSRACMPPSLRYGCAPSPTAARSRSPTTRPLASGRRRSRPTVGGWCSPATWGPRERRSSLSRPPGAGTPAVRDVFGRQRVRAGLRPRRGMGLLLATGGELRAQHLAGSSTSSVTRWRTAPARRRRASSTSTCSTRGSPTSRWPATAARACRSAAPDRSRLQPPSSRGGRCPWFS